MNTKSRTPLTLSDAKKRFSSPRPSIYDHLEIPPVPDEVCPYVSRLCRLFRDGAEIDAIMKRQPRPMNHVTLTGEFHALRKQIDVFFKSPLERDYLLRLEFDPCVARFDVRPVTVEYEFLGERRRFQPAIIVHFRRTKKNPMPRPWLVDVRTSRDLKTNSAENEARVASALEVCKSRGWEFRTRTEVEIRTPYLSNARFFIPFRSYESIEPEFSMLRDAARYRDQMTPAELITSVTARLDKYPQLTDEKPDRDVRRARLLTMVWKLLAIGWLLADFHAARVDENSIVWPASRQRKGA
jgi:hypothetical protein